jgi:arginine utilization regulatory protein
MPIINQEQTYLTYKGKEVSTVNTTLPVKIEGDIIGAIEISTNITDVKALSEKVVDLQNKVYGTKKNVISEHATYRFEHIITKNIGMQKAKTRAMKAAQIDSSVLIVGETGTGKELFVQSIHNSSNRRKNQFIPQNCAALPTSLLESILFGTVKGSFTGATDRPGLFEMADGGTLFLDEINSMPVELQSKLLRVLQDGILRRVGDTRTRKVDVKVIAATNVNPHDLVKSGQFRSDLYYRLSTIIIELPSLRLRREDIPLLINFFMKKYNEKFYLHVKGVTPDAMEMLEKYNWPGNVRELENTIEGAMSILEGKYIKLEDLPANLIMSVLDEESQKKYKEKKSLKEVLKETEIEIIKKALKDTHYNISKTAKVLEIPRQTLQYKIKNLDIDIEKENQNL